MAKDGRAHLDSLRDGREVFISGERVADVTVHPAFRNSVASAAHLCLDVVEVSVGFEKKVR